MREPIQLPTLTYEGVTQLGKAVSGTTNTETVQQLVTRLYGGRWQTLRVWRLDTGDLIGGIDRQRLRRGRAYWYNPDSLTIERARP